MKNHNLAVAALAVLLIPTILNAAEVKHNVYLRKGPSSKSEKLRLLHAGDEFAVVSETSRNGYIRIETSDHVRGYAWKRNLKLEEVAPSASTHHAVTGAADEISKDWDKPNRDTQPFKMANGKMCKPAGGGNDPETEERKNRRDAADNPHDVTIRAIAELPYDHAAAKERKNWTAKQLAEIKPSEGIPVRTTGYLVHFVEKTGKAVDAVREEGTENCNCGSIAHDDVDWHLSLVSKPRLPEKKSVVVEVTPRIRALHDHKWTLEKMNTLINSDSKVRITGWTMMDPEHENMLGQHRSTRWEIHPITNIEIEKDQKWVLLDDYEP